MEMVLQQPLYKRLAAGDWLYALLIIVAAGYSFSLYGSAMDYYEQLILVGSSIGLVALGWFWPSWRWFFPLAGAVSLLAIQLYDHNLARAAESFGLKYLLSSQSSFMWMCTLFFLATVLYWAGTLSRAGLLMRMGSGLTWAAAVFALAGLFTRWYESYLIAPDVGRIPVSNLYEVFILFCLITALMYLYYEAKFAVRQVGAFVLLVISAAVGFILWYTFDRQAHEIQPLIPALQSWWMKIHVPANFIGYGTFALAAMVAFAYLIKQQATETRWYKLAPLWLLGVVLCFEPIVFRQSAAENGGSYWFVYFGISALIVATIMFGRRRIAERLPSFEVLDDVMYKAIAVGFAFFTIATVLGALWAAEAWGGYWSWDPKETWALIVWLNYAAWLHMRLMKGLRGTVAAWWALVGLAITTFAFLGVNMFLSGLHSYGEL